MNYRHAFHAGNFADLFKHAVLLSLLRHARATAGRRPLTVIDTHAGAGLYDLRGAMARRTGEGAAVDALMAEAAPPAVFAPLVDSIRAVNAPGDHRFYPGSPVLVARALRPADRLVACEALDDEARTLAAAIGGARVRRGDGWRRGFDAVPPAPASTVILVDPPYETPGEGERIAGFAAAALRRNRQAVVAVWSPIKDLATFDSLRGRLAAIAPGLVIETRLRRFDDPLRLNGCAMIVLHPPEGLAAEGRAAAVWIAARFGGGAGEGRVEAL